MVDKRGIVLRALLLVPSRRRVDHCSLGSLTEREEPNLKSPKPQSQTQASHPTQAQDMLPFCRTLQAHTPTHTHVVAVTEVVVVVWERECESALCLYHAYV